MEIKLTSVCAVLCFVPALLTAQLGPTTDANRRTGTAVRTDRAPKLDGEISDDCWKSAPVMTDFITNQPFFGKPASEKTEVRIVYTDEAVYIGAYMYQPGNTIRSDLSKRDGASGADQLHIGLDTYRDRQNAFRFQVTAGGVQSDIRMSPDNFDTNWDAVWDCKVKLHDDGWSAELRIPFSAIRFPKQPVQHWGLQFARQIQYVNEFSSWSPVDPAGGGAMPQWGNLEGLRDIQPPLRLAFSPYLAASAQRSPTSTDPVAYTSARTLSGGLDVKWGLSESFTLDATLVPNFGEAQSDNTVRNLSPFEVLYEERRQFFTEGTELYGKGGIFYSRRIGGSPPGFASAKFAVEENEVLKKNPAQTQLLNATKLSGRTKSKLGIGVLNAVAAPANALIQNKLTGEERKFPTSQLTNYNVLVLDQALRNNSAVSLVNTNILREGAARDANVSALTFNLRDRNNRYEVFGENRLSLVWPTGADRADAGFGYRYGMAKVSGTWGWLLAHAATDGRYDPRDMGLLTRNNFSRLFGQVSHSNYQQRGNIASTYVQASVRNTWLKQPSLWESVEVEGYGELTNTRRQTFSLYFTSRPLWYYDFFEPRVAGAKFYHAPFAFFGPGFSTNSSKRLFAKFQVFWGESPIPNDPYIGVEVSPTWAATNHLRLTGQFNISKDHSNFGAVDWFSDPKDIVFGRRNITTFNNELGVEYLFGPRMNIAARVRHYWANLYYHQYYHLNDDGTLLPKDWTGTADENFNQFNVDFVYTWQFAPGSFLNLIWKDAAFAGDYLRGGTFARNLDKTLRSPQDNTVTVKLIYWLDAGGWRKV